jgi:hypothetical protein
MQFVKPNAPRGSVKTKGRISGRRSGEAVGGRGRARARHPPRQLAFGLAHAADSIAASTHISTMPHPAPGALAATAIRPS